MVVVTENHSIRSLRIRADWTQEQLATKAGVAIRTIARIENIKPGFRFHPLVVNRILFALNDKLGTDYTPGDLEIPLM